MALGVLELLIVVFCMIPLFVWWLVCLIQAIQTPDSVWAAADQSKLIYVLLMIFLGLLGTILYLLIARPALKRVGTPV